MRILNPDRYTCRELRASLSALPNWIQFLFVFLSLQRDCNEACTIKGVNVPKGMPVMITSYAVHRDPEIWPEPERFNPER